MRCATLALLAWTLAVAGGAHAQSVPLDTARASLCPAGSGLRVAIAPGASDSAVRPDSAEHLPGRRDGVVVDTTWRFDVDELRWSRPYFQATVGLGWNGASAGDGTTSAPDSASARSARACVGAVVGMREPTLVLRRARGAVRLRVDLRDLRRTERETPDSTAIRPRR